MATTVQIEFTDTDIDNAKKLARLLKSSSKAQDVSRATAVSTALSISAQLAERMVEHNETLYLGRRNEAPHRVIIPVLDGRK